MIDFTKLRKSDYKRACIFAASTGDVPCFFLSTLPLKKGEIVQAGIRFTPEVQKRYGLKTDMWIVPIEKLTWDENDGE